MTSSDPQDQHTRRVDRQVRTLSDLLREGEINDKAATTMLRSSIQDAVDTGWAGAQAHAAGLGHLPWAAMAFAAAGFPVRVSTQAQITEVVRAVLDEMVSADFYDISEDLGRDRVARQVSEALAPLVLPAG